MRIFLTKMFKLELIYLSTLSKTYVFYQAVFQLSDALLAMLGVILEHIVFGQNHAKVCIKRIKVYKLL